MSDLAYRSKQSNGYDASVMALFADALRITPDRLTKLRFWVAEEDGRIVGCIALEHLGGTTGEVRSFFTDPEHKGRGIGRRLWYELRTIAQTQGITYLLARADPASVLFYESLGFETKGEVPSRAYPSQLRPYMIRQI